MKSVTLGHLILTAGALFGWSAATCVPRPRCVQPTPGGPWNITSICVDPLYESPVIDDVTDLADPVPHRRVSGHFNGTAVDFKIYLPEKSAWEGRFFQEVYPLKASTPDDYVINFGLDSGAYTLQVSGTLGYRADAAAAKFSRKVAREYYDMPSGDIYGYVYGGSGGSFQVVGAMEQTYDVWQGSVILVQAVPIGSPNSWLLRGLAGFTLASKKAEIIDAVSPGGSGDPYALLDEAQSTVLKEATALGIPLASFEDFEGVSGQHLWDTVMALGLPRIQSGDPSYVQDFWTLPGYLGTESSALGDLYRASLVQFSTTVRQVTTLSNGSMEVVLGDMPRNLTALTALGLQISTDSASAIVSGADPRESKVLLPASSPLSNLTAGTSVRIDNRLFLASHTFYRHQVPPKERGFYALDYLRNSNGEPKYPQRASSLSYSSARSTSGGSNHTGNIHAKTILMDGTLDFDAFPWHADWYRSQVQRSLGDRFEDNFRIYYTENADHGIWDSGDEAPKSTRVVDSMGAYHQHLRDLAAWVERGIAPADDTGYTVEAGQVHLAARASERHGIQPLVHVTVDGRDRAETASGEAVTLHVDVEVPDKQSSVVSVECDWDGTGNYTSVDFGTPRGRVTLDVEHVYEEPGTYVASVRVASHRQGDTESPHARVRNLGRVRVVVS